MNKIKMTQTGWENYTGSLMGISFEGGLSVNIVDPQTAGRLGCIVAIENATDGSNPSNAQSLLDNQAKPMTVMSSGLPSGDTSSAPVVATVCTREQLEAIADKDGISGLRKIAPEGVKGTSIAKLIDGILETQEPAKVEAAVPEAAAPEVVEPKEEAPVEPSVAEEPVVEKADTPQDPPAADPAVSQE